MQAMLSLDSVWRYVDKFEYEPGDADTWEYAVFEILKQVYRDYLSTFNHKPLEPSCLINYMRFFNKDLNTEQQQDAHEFLISVIGRLDTFFVEQ